MRCSCQGQGVPQPRLQGQAPGGFPGAWGPPGGQAGLAAGPVAVAGKGSQLSLWRTEAEPPLAHNISQSNSLQLIFQLKLQFLNISAVTP